MMQRCTAISTFVLILAASFALSAEGQSPSADESAIRVARIHSVTGSRPHGRSADDAIASSRGDRGCSSPLNWCKIALPRAPHAAAAPFVANRMRELGILLRTDGPHHNVVKIRPPIHLIRWMLTG